MASRKGMSKIALEASIFDDGRSKWICCGSICVLSLLMRLACSTGLIASDDLWYSHYAQLITQHRYLPQLLHVALRYGLTIPVALAYWLFGIREWTTVLVPFLASVASIPVLMTVGWRMFGPRTGLMAGILFATFPLELRYATILVPEPVTVFYVLVAMLAYLYAESKGSLLLGLATGICLGAAYLTKEPALLVALALMIYVGMRRQWRVILGMALGLGMIVGLEHFYYLMRTGDLLFRLHAMAEHNRSTLALEANQNLFYRLVIAYPRRMLLPNMDFGVHSVFSLGLMALGLILFRVERFRLLLLWAVLPWLCLNFCSSSLTSYFVLPEAARYLDLVYPPLFLLAGAVLDRLTSERRGITL